MLPCAGPLAAVHQQGKHAERANACLLSDVGMTASGGHTADCAGADLRTVTRESGQEQEQVGVSAPPRRRTKLTARKTTCWQLAARKVHRLATLGGTIARSLGGSFRVTCSAGAVSTPKHGEGTAVRGAAEACAG